MTDTTTENKSSLSEAEKFLESLNLPDAQNQETDGVVTGTDPNDIMSFLDEISNYPTEDASASATTNNKENKEMDTAQQQKLAASTTKSSAATKSDQTGTTASEAQEEQHQLQESQQQQQKDNSSWTSWGNSFWNQASAAVKTTTDQINRSVGSDSASKLLESRVKTLQSLVNKENIEKIGKDDDL